MFWRIAESEFEAAPSLNPKSYENDDPCHTNIVSLTKSQARAVGRKASLDKIEICAPEGIRAASLEDMGSSRNP